MKKIVDNFKTFIILFLLITGISYSAIKHTFVSSIADGTDSTQIRPSNWNSEHSIEAETITNALLANMATKTYKGRTTAATGVPEDVPVATLKTDLVLVKGDVGLGNVDNTADTAKPVSTAQQTALDLKANLASPIFTGTVTLPAGTAKKSNMAYTAVSVTIAGEATISTTAVDSTLIGGEILGIYPAGNQDRHVDNVSLNASGQVIVTLETAAIATNSFKVVVLKP